MGDLYLEIKKIADRQTKGEVLTRADLTFELKKCGISHDSSDISRLVYEAWKRFDKSDKIYKAFITNDKSHSVVEAYEIQHAAESRDAKGLAKISKTHLGKGAQALKTLKENIEDTLDDYDAGSESEIRSIITGSSGAENVQRETMSAYKRYSELINAYDSARSEVRATMSDFIFLREQVNDILRRYSIALTDIFGDSIRAIDPRMFDFDSVEWLDVKGMLENVKLEYDTISGSCSTLIQEITEDFGSSLKSSVQMYRGAGSRSAGFALAAMGMVSHYIGAAERTATLKKELVRFTDKIKKDAMTIKGDSIRLNVIYRTISELYIPKANAFYKYADNVLTNELEELLDSIYSNDVTAHLKNKRDILLDTCRETEQRILDAQMNIDFYAASIKTNKQILESNKDNYRQAMALRPSKPFFLWNILTLGGAEKRFNRELSEWYDNYSDAVKYYENLLVDIKMDQDELNNLKLELKKDSAAFQKNKAEIKKLCEKMKETVLVSAVDKERILNHLESIVQLLKIAKDIVSSGLDEKHIKAVRISDYKSLELPESIRKSIESISAEVRSHFSENIIAPEKNRSDALAEAKQELILKTVSLFERYAELKSLQLASSISDAEYMERLNELQKEFDSDFDKISSRGDILRESLRLINTSESPDELKCALLTLSGSDGIKMSGEDFDKFLKGEINIEI